MSSSEDESIRSKRPKTQLDEQRLKIQKLMENPDKEVHIPVLKETQKPKAFNTHEFVRNVMGASAGAGSGEFDIYRGCRRRELARQEFLETEDQKKKIKEEFDKKLLENKLEDDLKTAKKREKRLKNKQKLKNKKNVKKNDEKQKNDESENAEDLEEIDLTEIEDKKHNEKSDKTSNEKTIEKSDEKTNEISDGKTNEIADGKTNEISDGKTNKITDEKSLDPKTNEKNSDLKNENKGDQLNDGDNKKD